MTEKEESEYAENMVHVRWKDGTIVRVPESRWEQHLKENPRYARKLQRDAEKLEKRISTWTPRARRSINKRYRKLLIDKIAELKAQNKEENNDEITKLEKDLTEAKQRRRKK